MRAHRGTAGPSLNSRMRVAGLVILVLVGCTSARGEREGVRKDAVSLWYEAFNTKDPTLLDRILAEDWVDIPAAPGQPAEPAGAKHILAELVTTFPGLRITIQDTLQDGNKVAVRSEITATQLGAFLGISTKNRTMTIQAIDIHEFKDGRIVRTWHTEDWMTGLRQLGVFEE